MCEYSTISTKSCVMEELSLLAVFILLLGILVRSQGNILWFVLAFTVKLFFNGTRNMISNCWNRKAFLNSSIPISDLRHCKKILSHPAWPDRVHSSSALHFASYGKPLGLILGCGEEYKRARRVSNKMLNHIGFHNSSKIEELVERKVTEFLNNLKKLVSEQNNNQNDDNMVSKGAIWCPKRKLNCFAVAIVMQILFGQNFPNFDVVTEKIVFYIDNCNRKFGGRAIRWFVEDTFISKLLSGCLRMWAWCRSSYFFYRIAKGVIQDRREKARGLQQGTNNFLDAYLFHLGQMTNEFEMTDEALLVVLRDILIGTGETVGSALEFAILHIALNPSVQERLQIEIDHAVGRSRCPRYSEKNKMLYTQATILEVLRHGSVISPGERVAVEDNTIDGTFYPKGTVVAIKHYEIHRSKELWDNPELFRPERFLNHDGSRLENKGKIIPFGYGTRFCIGESIAQVALFMFLTGLVHEFSFEIQAGMPHPSGKTIRGQARSPDPYFVRIMPRDL